MIGRAQGLNTGQDGIVIIEFPMMNTVNISLKKKITTLESPSEMRQMTFNYPKFDLKKSLETLNILIPFDQTCQRCQK